MGVGETGVGKQVPTPLVPPRPYWRRWRLEWLIKCLYVETARPCANPHEKRGRLHMQCTVAYLSLPLCIDSFPKLSDAVCKVHLPEMQHPLLFSAVLQEWGIPYSNFIGQIYPSLFIGPIHTSSISNFIGPICTLSISNLLRPIRTSLFSNFIGPIYTVISFIHAIHTALHHQLVISLVQPILYSRIVKHICLYPQRKGNGA